MKPFLHFPVLFLLLVAAGCTGPTAHSVTDFTEKVYTPRYASGFDIRGMRHGASTLLTVRNPWQAARGVEQYLLVLREDEKAPSDFPGQVIKAPVKRVVCMSSSHVAMFDALGQMRRISGVSGIDYLSNDYVKTHRYCGEVRDVGYDTNLDFELLAALRPGVVLLYGVTGENTVVTGKLRELGIPYLYIGDYMEESPLGKAEWMLAVAELCDCREAGTATFGGIADRYNRLKEQVDTTTARPRVMLNTPYRDTWFMPSKRSYMVRLVEDAGGEYIYPENDSDTSVAIELEKAYLLASAADIWLNTGACNTLGELCAQTPKFARVPAVLAHRVYNNNRRQTPAGGSDFWESGVVRPDRVLQDLIGILHDRDAETYYYKRLE